jgi:hypothetical protein
MRSLDGGSTPGQVGAVGFKVAMALGDSLSLPYWRRVAELVDSKHVPLWVFSRLAGPGVKNPRAVCAARIAKIVPDLRAEHLPGGFKGGPSRPRVASMGDLVAERVLVAGRVKAITAGAGNGPAVRRE